MTVFDKISNKLRDNHLQAVSDCEVLIRSLKKLNNTQDNDELNNFIINSTSIVQQASSEIEIYKTLPAERSEELFNLQCQLISRLNESDK